MPSTPETDERAAPVPEGLTSRRRGAYLAAALALLLTLVVPVALLSGGSGESGDGATATPTGASGAASSGKVSGPSFEGRIVVAEPTRLVINTAEPIDGQGQFELVVRSQDAAGVDVPHLRVHAAGGLPSRIFYEQEGKTRYAVGQQDADTAPNP